MPVLVVTTSLSRVAMPTFSPVAGSYTGNQSVTIYTTTTGASIYYTLDGSTPTTASTLYAGAINVNTSETINALAVASGYTNSLVATAAYSITSNQAATPVFTPAAGSYGSAQTVQITCASAGPSIYYTTDGSTPTTASTLYVNPVPVSATTTLKAIATALGYTTSAVGSATYTITNTQTATPVLSPTPGTYTSAQTVTLTCSTPSSTIYYTTNGTTPTTGSTVYTAPITVSSTETVQAIATASGYTQSNVGSGVYTISAQVATPVFSPAGGSYTSSQSVTITCSTSSSTIYYTTNGTTPTTSSTVYTGAISVSSTETVKAIATASGLAQSNVGSASYIVGQTLYDSVIALSGKYPVNGAGQVLQLRGANMSGLENSAAQGQTPDWADGGSGAPKWSVFATWAPNVARIPLNALSFLQQTGYVTKTLTTVTFTAIPTYYSSGTTLSTGGNLTSPWTFDTGYYPVNFNGNSAPLTNAYFTTGSVQVIWTQLDWTGSKASAPSATATVVGWGASRAADYNGTYRSTIQTAIANARANKCYIIFDLHWTSPQFTIGGQTNYLMPLGQSAFIDTTGLAFWQAFYAWLVSVYGAGNFQDMVFELFNEPFLDLNGYILTTTQGGSTTISSDLILKNGGYSSCAINRSQNGSNYVLGMAWQVIGYQAVRDALRGAGCTNVLLTNGNDYSRLLQNHAVWQITDPLNQTGFGWHPYGQGTYPYSNGNVGPGIGSDSNANTNNATQWANAIQAAGYCVWITEDGGQAGTSATAIPQEPHMAYMQQWARSTGAPYIAWEFTDTQGYGTVSNQNVLTVFNSGGTQTLPIQGAGYTTNKFMTRVKAPMTCISRSGINGQATSGSTTTCTDALANWITNQWVGSKFIDNISGQGGLISANTANTLTFAAISNSVAAGDGYSILTAQIVPYVNNATYPASNVTDPSGNNVYQSSTTMPSYIAFDLSSFVSQGGTAVYVSWYNDATYNYNAYAVNPSNPYYNVPGSYTFDVNTAAGGTVPTTGWTTVYSATGNDFNRQHLYVPMGSANWIRMNVTVINGSSGNDRLGVKIDLYDASYGATDGLFIAGDSITANGMGYSGSHDSICNYAAGQLGTSTTTPSSLGLPGYYNSYPFPYINGGMAGWTSSQYLAVFSGYLSNFPGLYVGLALGTNDLPLLASGTSTYTSNMTSMINQIIAAGKIPVMATMPYCTDSQHQAGVSVLLGAGE